MPYTPPSQRSPASSTTASPVISRNHSYTSNGVGGHPAASTVTQRPSLPRSLSSTAYLQKHRRSPSISDKQPVQPPTTTSVKREQQPLTNGNKYAVHQHIHTLMSADGDTGSGSSSSDEDRGRRVDVMSLQQLEEALAKLDPRPIFRGHSPTRETREELLPALTAPLPGSNRGTSPSPLAGELASTALSNEARKISHSRSSSDVLLPTGQLITTADLPPTHTSDDSDEDDLRIKPPLLRKKSGELVKPALRPSSHSHRRRPLSMPGTPTYHKAVHFNEDIEQVRHFLQVDRPIAVSAGSSPVETYESETDFPWGSEEGGHVGRKSSAVEWEIKTTNFPRDTFERQAAPVRVERIFLSSDNKSLVGTVACANLAFSKAVVARFTLDYWKTTSEVVAEYNNDVRKKQANDGFDRFNFNIKLADQAHLETKTLLLCVRYNVSGQEYWDNNANMNYQIDFMRKSKPRQAANKGGMHAGSLGAIPRSRHSPSAGRNAHTQPTSPDDDFVSRVDGAGYHFGVQKLTLGESPNNTIRLRNHHRTGRKGSIFPAEARNAAAVGQAQGFSTRYDFSASLTAALNNAQTALGSRSGLTPRQQLQPQQQQPVQPPSQKVPSGALTVATAVKAEKPADEVAKPGALAPQTEARPGLQSAEYNDLIQKYCFFGSGTVSKTVSPPSESATKSTDAPDEAAGELQEGSNNNSFNSSATSSAASSRESSGSNSPTPALAAPPTSAYDGSHDGNSSGSAPGSRHHSRTPSGYGSSRSQSPAHYALRSGSPVPFEGQAQGFGYGMFEATAQVATHG